MYSYKNSHNQQFEFETSEDVFYPTGTSLVLLKNLEKNANCQGKILDLGCGCGLVGIIASLNSVGSTSLFASDISKEAVELTKKNAKKFNVNIQVKVGSLFDPWKDYKFDYILDDVSGISSDLANISPWFKNIPCQSGRDGSDLIVRVLNESKFYLNPKGRLLFPIISLSNEDKILEAARSQFKYVNKIHHEEWPLPSDFNCHANLLSSLESENCIKIIKKFGMMIFYTDIYEAYN